MSALNLAAMRAGAKQTCTPALQLTAGLAAAATATSGCPVATGGLVNGGGRAGLGQRQAGLA